MGDTRAIEWRQGDSLQPTEGVLRPARVIGGSLGALAHATLLYRKGRARHFGVPELGATDSMRTIAERAARAWRTAEPSALLLEPTRATVAGDHALAADEEGGQWVHYAFMAGVRCIEPRRTMTAGHVIRLVHALVTLQPVLRSLDLFRAWLAADAADGFDVRLDAPFRELLAEAELPQLEELARAGPRYQVLRPSEVVSAGGGPDAVALLRRELELPLERYSAYAPALAAVGLSETELRAIGKRCDDESAWARAELQAVVSAPRLRTAVSPEWMARRIVTRLSEERDERLLLLLTRLDAGSDPFVQAVAQALATVEVGEVVARQLDLHSAETVEAVGRFLVLSPNGVAQAVVGGLLERGLDDPTARDAVGLLADWYGCTQLCDWTAAERLRPETAHLLGSALARGELAPEPLTRLAQACEVGAALRLLGALSDEALAAQGRALRFLWGRVQEPEWVQPVAELMIVGAARDNLVLLGDLLLQGELDDWQASLLYRLCSRLVDRGLGHRYVLTLALRRAAPEALRLIALDCLPRDPALVAEACRFRASRFLESAAVRERLRKIRRAVTSRAGGE